MTNHLINTVLDTLHTLPSVNTVLYETTYYSNIKLDRLNPNFAICYLVTNQTIDISLRRFTDSVDVEIFFCDTLPFDSDGEAIQTIVDVQTTIAKSFISALYDIKDIVIDNDVVNLKTAYGKFDKNVAGVTVDLTIKSKKAECI